MNMNISPISSLLKEVMSACGLKQKDLGDVLQVPLDRVKSLTSGKVKKLNPDETRRLVQTLNLSAHWLATGEGPMFNTQGGQKLGEILTQLRLTTARLAEMEIDGPVASAVVSIVHGVAEKDAHSLKDGLMQAAYAMQTPDERALLDTYRRCTGEAKANLIQTAALLSAGMPVNSGSTPTNAPTISIGRIHGDQSQITSGNITNHGPLTFGVSPPKPKKSSK
jgi:hypothetical protein